MIYHSYNFIRFLLYPFVRFLLPLVSRQAKKRLSFELSEVPEPQSFKAKYAFEVSSEGELEQIYSVLINTLHSGAKVELIYCSPSVKHKVDKLVEHYSDQLKAFPLPILAYFPYSDKWNPARRLTAESFFMCRYDFFPELIYYGATKTRNFILLSASLINFESKSFLSRVYLKSCLKKFTQVVAVSQKERTNIALNAGLSLTNIEVFDFRAIQINNRLKDREKTLSKQWRLYGEFKSKLKKSTHPPIILGNFWNHEFELVHSLASDFTQIIVPHNLRADDMEALELQLKNSGLRFSILSREDQELPSLNELDVIVLNIKGILCELYGLFELAYVGGGFGDSVHSVLEPYMNGCRVFTGPKIYRSSEFDIINEYDSQMISAHTSFQDLSEAIKVASNKNHRGDSFADHFNGHLDPLLSWLNLKEEVTSA